MPDKRTSVIFDPRLDGSKDHCQNNRKRDCANECTEPTSASEEQKVLLGQSPHLTYELGHIVLGRGSDIVE